MKLGNLVQKQIVTEKSLARAETANEYMFKVNLKASKYAVAQEVSKIYGVEVEDIRTMIMPGKKRRLGKSHLFTKTKKWKKAIIKIKDGQKIDLMGEK